MPIWLAGVVAGSAGRHSASRWDPSRSHRESVGRVPALMHHSRTGYGHTVGLDEHDARDFGVGHRRGPPPRAAQEGGGDRVVRAGGGEPDQQRGHGRDDPGSEHGPPPGVGAGREGDDDNEPDRDRLSAEPEEHGADPPEPDRHREEDPAEHDAAQRHEQAGHQQLPWPGEVDPGEQPRADQETHGGPEDGQAGRRQFPRVQQHPAATVSAAVPSSGHDTSGSADPPTVWLRRCRDRPRGPSPDPGEGAQCPGRARDRARAGRPVSVVGPPRTSGPAAPASTAPRRALPDPQRRGGA